MTITQARFDQGMTYEEYKAQMTRNRERLEANERTVELSSDDIAFFAGLAQPIRALVLAEDWCGDVVGNLPVLGRLAAESGAIDIRVFLRDEHLDLMDQYLNNGSRSIPVFAFFDAEFKPLGAWIERPARISELQASMRQSLFASDPAFAGVAPDTSLAQLPEAARDRLMGAIGAFRDEHRLLSDREVVREIRGLVARGLGRAAAPASPLRPILEPHVSRGKRPLKVSITYCASCGYEPQTLELAAALMREFVYDLASIELIPWQDGAFDVVVDGDLVHSMFREGGFPDNAAVAAAVRERLARA